MIHPIAMPLRVIAARFVRQHRSLANNRPRRWVPVAAAGRLSDALRHVPMPAGGRPKRVAEPNSKSHDFRSVSVIGRANRNP